MRTYLISKDKTEEHIIDLTKTIIHSSELVEFEFQALKDNKVQEKQNIFIRQLGGQYFVSEDQVKWEKLARQNLPTKMLNINRVFDVFYGYKPSGLTGGSAGELLTQMPGKVVKISIEEGQKVAVGQTLLVLEAMKMENEIKAAMNGVVKKIHVKEGDALDQGVLMIELEEK